MGWLKSITPRFERIIRNGIAIENLFWSKKKHAKEEVVSLQEQIIDLLKKEIALLESIICNQEELINKQDTLIQTQASLIKLIEEGRKGKVVAFKKRNGNGSGKKRA